MLINTKLVAAVLVVGVFLGASASGADGANGRGGAPAGGGGGQLPEGMRQEAIHDPAMNMDAYFVTVPADWRFQGAVQQGTGCNQEPFPMFRTASADGLTQLERLPRFDWKWGDAPWLPKRTPPGCLPLMEGLTASEFLKRLAVISEVEYVAEVPIPGDKLEAQKAFFEQRNAMTAQMAARFHNEPAVQHGDMAQAKVRYRNGSTPMEALLFVNLSCIHNPFRDFKKRSFWVDS